MYVCVDVYAGIGCVIRKYICRYARMFAHADMDLHAGISRIMCACVCIYIYIHTHIYTYICTYLYLYISGIGRITSIHYADGTTKSVSGSGSEATCEPQKPPLAPKTAFDDKSRAN